MGSGLMQWPWELLLHLLGTALCSQGQWCRELRGGPPSSHTWCEVTFLTIPLYQNPAPTKWPCHSPSKSSQSFLPHLDSSRMFFFLSVYLVLSSQLGIHIQVDEVSLFVSPCLLSSHHPTLPIAWATDGDCGNQEKKAQGRPWMILCLKSLSLLQ